MRQRNWVKVHQLDGHVFATGTPYCPIQMMSYVIETEEGSLVVIDGGNVGDDVKTNISKGSPSLAKVFSI